MDTQIKTLENHMSRNYLVYKVIPTAMPMFSEMTFSMAILFTLPDGADTPEINMAYKKRK